MVLPMPSPPTISLTPGKRVLYLTKDAELIRRQLAGELDLTMADVAVEDSLLLSIGCQEFYDLHVEFPEDFGIFMINLARELAREIELLEDVIGHGTGWEAEVASA